MSNYLPIAVFDSGVGGVSILRELIRIMPNENFIYFGDCANSPYGSKPLEEIRKLTFNCVSQLVKKNIKALVIACNTATGAAIDSIREMYPQIPVIGVEPAIKPAALQTQGGRVLVMATPATLSEDRVEALLQAYNKICSFELLPCRELAHLIEEGHIDDNELYSYLKSILSPYKNKVQSVVLGCTHYPFVKNAIISVLGDDVNIFDGSLGTANEVFRRLHEANLLNSPICKGELYIESSGNTAEFEKAVKHLLNK